MAIARALVTGPKLVLADEPTANLDSVTGENILALMQELNRTEKTTFIFSTHDAKVMAHATTIVRLADGKVVERDQPGRAASVRRSRWERTDVLATLKVLLQIAFRNLFASRLKTFIVGGIVFFGALIVTVGGSLLDSVVSGMSRSIIGSSPATSRSTRPSPRTSSRSSATWAAIPDLEQIDDFEKIRKTRRERPQRRRVVPMGISGALVTSGNTIDLVLEQAARCRSARSWPGDKSPAIVAADPDAEGPRPADRQRAAGRAEERRGHPRRDQDHPGGSRQRRRARPRRQSDVLGRLRQGPARLARVPREQDRPADLRRRHALPALRGHRPGRLPQSFDRFQIVDGQLIPEGHRGFLFSKYFYEEQVKLQTARRLDKITTPSILKRAEDRRPTPTCSRWSSENTKQTREILLQLDATSTAKMRGLLAG